MKKVTLWSKLLFSLALAVGLGLIAFLNLKAGVASTQASAAVQQTELRVCRVGCFYTNVQAAVDAAKAGDVIKVAGGVYEGVLMRVGLRQMVYPDTPMPPRLFLAPGSTGQRACSSKPDVD